MLVLWGLWLLWLWQPERQVRLHTTQFLKKVQQRNWKAVPAFMADDFSDRWGHNKAAAVEDAEQVFSQFLFLTIENRTEQCEVHGREGTTSTWIKISGNGSAIAQLVMERVNGLQKPFIFTWRKVGSAPWEWQLTHIDQPELNIDPGAGF
ncbi:conserved hypothetical protein [Chthoniobacter flavus Ellin428]|uniref:SnoaL-like domain-containing protein n=1 Tax=Chthoniobacter flavus Ellin428 TaxID=497964 RepID=B4D9R0_9BACT|nr:conserved hypothetical protein [Chthoniobacter flavus Ellin428]TCO93336.1 hypothetical protein EV701_10438 [Chthoniobacter flavus]